MRVLTFLLVLILCVSATGCDDDEESPRPHLNLFVSGSFADSLDSQGGNLPASEFPFPFLCRGWFEGHVELSLGQTDVDTPFGYWAFTYSRVDIRIHNRSGDVVYTIDGGPGQLRLTHDHSRLGLYVGTSYGSPGVPCDLRLWWVGSFLADAALPALDQIAAATFTSGFVEVDGEVDFTFWDLPVVSANITATSGS